MTMLISLPKLQIKRLISFIGLVLDLQSRRRRQIVRGTLFLCQNEASLPPVFLSKNFYRVTLNREILALVKRKQQKRLPFELDFR